MTSTRKIRRAIPAVLSDTIYSLQQQRGRCLVDYELRRLVADGQITLAKGTSLASSQIQPASFQPTLGDQAYELDTDTSGLLRPHPDAALEEIVAELPKRALDINTPNGLELQTGHTYLVRLREHFQLDPDLRVKCSPRSSTGRIFLRTRVLADYNDCFDEVEYSSQSKHQPLGLWLLLQPLAFNTIVRPGQSLTQARFFSGDDARLSDSELKQLARQTPLLFMPPLRTALPPHFNEGLQIHLDLEGFYTKKVVGLRTKRTAEAIDLQQKGAYDTHQFYEPVRVQDHGDALVIPPGQCYLLYSKEIIHIPPNHSAELQGRTHISLDGDLHLAGFFDPGFNAHCVFEVRSNESDSIPLTHGMPMSRFQFYRNNIPEHPYGSQALGSSFQGQVGPQPPGCFKPIRYDYVRP